MEAINQAAAKLVKDIQTESDELLSTLSGCRGADFDVWANDARRETTLEELDALEGTIDDVIAKLQAIKAELAAR